MYSIETIIKEKPYGFFITNLPVSSSSITQIGPYSVYYCEINENKTKINSFETKDFYILYDGAFYSYFGKDIQYFNAHFFYDYQSNAQKALNGLHAELSIVIIDKSNFDIILVRDKMGLNDIFYSVQDSKIEIFNRFELSKFLTDLYFDDFGLSLYLNLNTAMYPYTIFNKVFGLPAAHHIRIDRFQLENIEKQHKFYWIVPAVDKDTSPEKLFKNLKDIYVDSIGKRISTGQNAIMYSGGLDSSTVLFAMLENVSSDRISPYYMSFSGYTAQNTFNEPVVNVCKSLNLNLKTIELSSIDHNRFDSVLNNISRIPIYYPTTDIFDFASKKIIDDHGAGIKTFIGESSDGIFGLNVTDEAYIDKISGINWGQLILKLNYSDDNTEKQNKFYSTIAHLIYPLKQFSIKPTIRNHIEAFSGIMKYNKNLDQLIKGFYFSPNRLPSIDPSYQYSQLLNLDTNKEIQKHFSIEFIENLRSVFRRDGIGSVSKMLSYRMEVESVDMKLKMIGKYSGLNTDFPISDSKFVEAAYQIPHKYYIPSNNQRPKYPLRKVAELLNIPDYILNKQKLSNVGNTKRTIVNQESDLTLFQQISEYTRKSTFFDKISHAKRINISKLEHLKNSFTAKTDYNYWHAMLLFRLEYISQNFNIKGIK